MEQPKTTSVEVEFENLLAAVAERELKRLREEKAMREPQASPGSEDSK